MRKITLEEIVLSGLCSGCGGCLFAVEKGLLEMSISSDGFLRPTAKRVLTDEESGAIASICPGLALEHPKRFEPGVEYHTVWGPVVQVMAGHATDPEVRYKGSSGGALSGLLIFLLDTKRIDFIVQTRASASAPLVNEAIFSETRADIIAAAGSRYAPAAPVAALTEALERKGRFAFVGKPCDVAAVRKIITENPKLNERIPYLLSFMCAGTPSLHGTRQILDSLGVKESELLSFRYRGDGWPGLATAETKNGHVATMTYNTAWGSILNRHLQSRCKMCADGTGEFADIVGADAWYGKDGYPDFEENEGRSLVMIRTRQGSDLINHALESGALSLAKFDIRHVSEIQPYQQRRKQEHLARRLAAGFLFRPWPKFSRFRLFSCSLQLSVSAYIRAFAGTFKRLLAGRL